MIDLYGIETHTFLNLMQLLDEGDYTYETHTDVDEITSMGFKSLPMLVVDGKEYTYKKAQKWLKNRRGG